MTETCQPICVDHILVSLDSSKHSFAALRVAIQLAHHYHAAITGLFVEDTTLLSLAKMPFRQEVGEYTAIVRNISTDAMTRSIFVQYKRINRTFRKLINNSELMGDFTVLRGKVSESIRKASEECDLLIMGKSGTNTLQRKKLGSTAQALSRDPQIPILLVEEENLVGTPISVIFDNSLLGKVSLETARDLLEQGDALNIILIEENPDKIAQQKKYLHQWSEKHQIDIKIFATKPQGFPQFLQKIKGLRKGLLILPHQPAQPDWKIEEICLEEVTLPVLIIRTYDVEQ